MGDTKAMDYGRGSTFMLGPNFRNIQVIEESELLIGWLDSTLTEEGRIVSPNPNTQQPARKPLERNF